MVSPDDLLALLDSPADGPRIRVLLAAMAAPYDRDVDDQFEQIWYSCASRGLAVLAKRQVVTAVHLYSTMFAQRRQWSQYPFGLPNGLRFGMSKSLVFEMFGPPHKGTGLHWAIYRLPTHGIRVGYTKDALVAVDLISLRDSLLNNVDGPSRLQ